MNIFSDHFPSTSRKYVKFSLRYENDYNTKNKLKYLLYCGILLTYFLCLQIISFNPPTPFHALLAALISSGSSIAQSLDHPQANVIAHIENLYSVGL